MELLEIKKVAEGFRIKVQHDDKTVRHYGDSRSSFNVLFEIIEGFITRKLKK